MSCFRHFILGFTFLFWVPLKSKVTASRGCRNIFVVVAFVCLISGSSLFKFINIRERNNTSEGYTLKDRVKGHTEHGDYRAKPKLGEDDRKCPLENPRQALESHDEFPYCQVGDSSSCVGQQPWVAWKPGFRALLQWGGEAVGGMEYPDPPSRIQQLLAWNHYQNRRAVHAANRSTLTDRANTPRLFRMMHSEAYHST